MDTAMMDFIIINLGILGGILAAIAYFAWIILKTLKESDNDETKS